VEQGQQVDEEEDVDGHGEFEPVDVGTKKEINFS
jgi:hypothetical protein